MDLIALGRWRENGMGRERERAAQDNDQLLAALLRTRIPGPGSSLGSGGVLAAACAGDCPRLALGVILSQFN